MNIPPPAARPSVPPITSPNPGEVVAIYLQRGAVAMTLNLLANCEIRGADAGKMVQLLGTFDKALRGPAAKIEIPAAPTPAAASVETAPAAVLVTEPTAA